uniref:Uncharacterized protein n=1 Tax=Cacopsylla melanoneura TaxID=428564 RepID=A0A8D8ZZ07_9HEMI
MVLAISLHSSLLTRYKYPRSPNSFNPMFPMLRCTTHKALSSPTRSLPRIRASFRPCSNLWRRRRLASAYLRLELLVLRLKRCSLKLVIWPRKKKTMTVWTAAPVPPWTRPNETLSSILRRTGPNQTGNPCYTRRCRGSDCSC